MKKRILLITLIGINFGIYSQTKIGFNMNDTFDVSGNSVAHYGMSRISGTGYLYVGLSGFFGLNFYTEGKERIKVLRNGNVGIGTSNPSAKLTLNNNSDYSKILQFGADGPTHWFMGIGNGGGDFFHLGDNSNKRFVIRKHSGNIGIGTTNPDSKLTVAGKIHAREIKVTVSAGADFVFEKDYKLPSLESIEKYVNENKHLPEITSENEMKENGLLLGEMNIKLLQKIEELTLYTIEQEKKIKEQSKKNENLESLNAKLLELQKRLEKLEKK